MKNNYNVTEIFASIEGEGKRTGYMATFIRLTGCNLRCTYCDTKYSYGEENKVMSEDEIIEEVARYPWKRITLTGGEPLLQNIDSLVHSLALKGYEVNIETNGSIPLLAKRYVKMFYTMDWKCPSSGENNMMSLTNLTKLEKGDVLKFVVGNTEDLDEMRRIIREKPLLYLKPLIYVSPVFGEIEPKEIVQYIKDNALEDVCVQVQLHKVIWEPDERGV